jgi:hypothetical protein
MTQTDDARGRIAHPFNGPDLPTEVFADPGRRGWYFREKMPDSVARFVRDDLAPDPLADPRVTALVEALRAERDYWVKRADADLADQDVNERIMDYPTPRKMTEAMRKADALVAALAAFDKGGKNE